MRSLFAKIFLWFWCAITIVIAALALVTWLYPYSAVPSGNLPDRLHELQTRGALAVYELKGQAAFEQHRRDLDQASRLRTYFLDDQGNELSGQEVPEGLLSFAREHQGELARGERVMVGQPSRLAIPMSDSKGRKYLALVQGGLGSGPRPMPPEGRGPAERAGEGGAASRPERAAGRDGGRPPGPPGSPGSGPGRGPPPPSSSLPRFELLVPTHVLLLRLLAMVLAAGLGCYLLARYLTLPLRRLQHTARQLAAGDLSVRVGERLSTRRDEIGELGRDFDRMAHQLEGLLTAQRRLLQDVSHELRSPLARLNVALELAGRDGAPASAHALARAGREADRLNELIAQLLTLARLESAGAHAPHMRFSLRTLVAEVVADADFEATARGRRVRFTGGDECEVDGAPDLVRSAVENVVRNAAQHTTDGSEVEVSLRLQAGEGPVSAVIEVRDHGPGVPENSLQHIFQPFHRVSGARDRVAGSSGGSGLGLAITDRAIRLHRGTVSAENAPDGGLIVRMLLPVAPGP